MSGPEDKTFQSIRLMSEKDASRNQGSLVTNGGIYSRKNIECECDIVAEKIIAKDNVKIAGNVSVGGTLYCPDLFTVNDDTIGFKRNLIPARPKHPICNDDLSSLGTCRDPWNTIYAKNINTENINIENINTENIRATSISIASNCSNIPSFEVNSGCVNINENFNIVNPQNNTVMMKTSSQSIETFVPNYMQWESVFPIQIPYQPNILLEITTSLIFINISLCDDISVCDRIVFCLDGNGVPLNTRVKIYFIRKNQSCKIEYKISLVACGKKYIFTSRIPSKKISLFFMDECVYLL